MVVELKTQIPTLPAYTKAVDSCRGRSQTGTAAIAERIVGTFIATKVTNSLSDSMAPLIEVNVRVR